MFALMSPEGPAFVLPPPRRAEGLEEGATAGVEQLLSENEQLRTFNSMLANENALLQMQAMGLPAWLCVGQDTPWLPPVPPNMLPTLAGATSLEGTASSPTEHDTSAPPTVDTTSGPSETSDEALEMQVVAKREGAAAATPAVEKQLRLHCIDNDGILTVHWPVDARRLTGKDRQVVSPCFDLGNMSYRLMLKPRASGTKKGQASFLRAKGRGYVEFKCESEVSEARCPVSFRLAVAQSSDEAWQSMRGPAVHDFAHGAVATLPQELEEWNLRAATDGDSLTLAVCLEVVLLPPC